MSKRHHKILIIKLGYSETLIPETRRACSLGDVFRTTAVLHLFKHDHVTWLTDEAAVPLLEGNPYIARILTFDLLNVLQLETEHFDKVINLEKVPGLCALANRINAWSHYGFRLDHQTGEAEAYERAYEALEIATREDVKKLNNQPWIAVLYRMLGAEWHGESYMLGARPSGGIAYDIGFNMQVGALLPVKAWPPGHWQELERLLQGRYTITHQQHLDNLRGYIEWISACRLLVTNDSLGLYLGIALGRRVLGLFGPTSATEQSPHERLRMLTPPDERPCMPCCKTVCAHGDPCIQSITPRRVCDEIEAWGVA
jgi:heptosyltransferase-2